MRHAEMAVSLDELLAPTRSYRDDRAFAYHEAGHVVATVVLGGSVERATIEQSGDMAGHIVASGLGWFELAVMSKCGMVAQALSGETPEDHHGHGDRQIQQRLISSRSDDERAAASARSLIRAYRPAVVRVAEELLRARTAGGEYLHAVVRQAEKDHGLKFYL